MEEKSAMKKLLKNRKVVEEIHRHQWLESEKSGYDIGFERAAEDWLKNFSKAWLNYHMPKKKVSPNRKASPVRKSSSPKFQRKNISKKTK